MGFSFVSVPLLALLCAPPLVQGMAAAADQPIPDVPTLINQVREHQKKIDKIREDYTYHGYEQTDTLDGKGRVKKTETEESEVFYVNGHEISRTVKKNGKDLSPDEQKKEQDRVNKQVQKALKTPKNKSIDDEELNASKILQVMKVSNPRREMLNGRPTLSFDFDGDPKAKAHGTWMEAAKKMSGTLWIDEADRQVARIQVRFDDNFRIGAGLLATIQKGTTFVFDQALINHELWLPVGGEAHLGARLLLFKGYNQNMRVKFSNYQKFHADAVTQPGAKVISAPAH